MRDFEADVNHSIELMTNDIFKHFDDSYNGFNPELLEKYKQLKSKIKDQKDENANLLKQIDLLNQEISQIFENIIKLGNRLDGLEKLCGVEKIEYEYIEDEG
jgi:chromosome segregation ATPase